MATIEKRHAKDQKNRFRVIVRVTGYPRRSATFDKIGDARRWSAGIEGQMRAGKYEDDRAAHLYTAAEMIERYERDVLPVKSTKTRYVDQQRKQLHWWKRQIGAYKLAHLNAFVLAECRDTLAKRLAPGTVNRYLAALSHVFTKAVRDWGWVAANPLQKVQKPSEPRGRVRFLSKDELQRLRAACRQVRSTPLDDVMLLALSTGARKQELLTIRLSDIDLERRSVTLDDTKNHERRRLALSGEALEMVRYRLEHTHLRQAYLFEHPRTRSPYQIDKAWDKARNRAGLPDFRFHDLRHTFASYMAMSGASLPEIAEALGHKKLEMVKRYAHLSESHTSAVIARMVAQRLTVADVHRMESSMYPDGRSSDEVFV